MGMGTGKRFRRGKVLVLTVGAIDDIGAVQVFTGSVIVV